MARQADLAAPWLAGLQAQGLQAAWMDPCCIASPETEATQPPELPHPEAWLLLEEEWLTPVLQAVQRQGRRTPVLLLIPPDAVDQAPALLQAGAADVWLRDLPMPLLARRLEVQIQLRRHQRALAKQLRYEAAVAECVRMLLGRGGTGSPPSARGGDPPGRLGGEQGLRLPQPSGSREGPAGLAGA